MSMLGAFLRGAAGPGLLSVVDRMDRSDAAAAEEERRRREREEDKAWRTEQAALDREARSELLKERLAASGGSGGSRSSSGGGDGGGGGSDDYKVSALMRQYQISEGEARRLVASGQAGVNPLTKPIGGDGVGPPELNAELWGEVNRTIAEAMRAGPSMARSNYEQLTAGDINTQRGKVNQRMLDGNLTMPQAAEANAAMSGKGAFSNARTDEFTGKPTAIGQSEINENNAQAGSANRANRDGGPDLAKLPPAVQRELKVLEEREKAIAGKITEARAADGGWNPDENPGQRQLMAEYRGIQLRRNALMSGGQSADPLGLFGDQPGSPAPAPKNTPKFTGENAAEDARLSRQPAPDGGGMLNRASSWLREQQDIEGQIKKRVQQAQSGGKPLTPGERQLAKRYGIEV